jgi:mRNA-degrading endonuclease RelE of RelBE toxin-antitoxin system
MKWGFTEMCENPFSGDIRFLKGLGGTLRKRVGDWRILFEINLENRLIFVTAIKRRGLGPKYLST